MEELNIVDLFIKEYDKWNKNNEKYKKYTPPIFGVVLNENNEFVFAQKIFSSERKPKKLKDASGCLNKEIKNSKEDIRTLIDIKSKIDMELSKTHVEQILLNELDNNKYSNLKNLTFILTIPPCSNCRKFIFNKKNKHYKKIKQILYLSDYKQDENYKNDSKGSDINEWRKLIKKYNLNDNFLENYKNSNLYNNEYEKLLKVNENFKKYRDSKNHKY